MPCEHAEIQIDFHGASKGARSTNEVCSCIQPKCTGILYWVLGLHVIILGGKGTFPCFLHASYMVLCTREKFLYI